MRPDFEYMTIAELRTYCSYAHKLGNRSHKLMQEITDLLSIENPEKSKTDRIQQKVKDIIKQMEVLGLASENNN